MDNYGSGVSHCRGIVLSFAKIWQSAALQRERAK